MKKGFVRFNPYTVYGDVVVIQLLGEGRWYECFIDIQDLPRVIAYRWYAEKLHKSNGTYYALCRRRAADLGDPKFTQVLSRFILGITDRAIMVDHIDGNGLNNRRHNLRAVSREDNCFHRVRLNTDNVTGYRNVHKVSSEAGYRVEVTRNKKKRYIGRFSTIEAANLAAIAARKCLYTEQI